MGASEFFTTSFGDTAQAAFRSAVEEAQYESGHGGYTGTIAEKDDFKLASSELFETREAAMDFASKKMEDDNHFCQDKWGPAGCVRFKGKDAKTWYLFFGWASS
jgi:hypothetical protein